VLSYEALARDLTPDHVLARIVSTVPAPRIAPSMSPTAAHAGQPVPTGGPAPRPYVPALPVTPGPVTGEASTGEASTAEAPGDDVEPVASGPGDALRPPT
jgi:MoxR-like ATPase